MRRKLPFTNSKQFCMALLNGLPRTNTCEAAVIGRGREAAGRTKSQHIGCPQVQRVRLAKLVHSESHPTAQTNELVASEKCGSGRLLFTRRIQHASGRDRPRTRGGGDIYHLAPRHQYFTPPTKPAPSTNRKNHARWPRGPRKTSKPLASCSRSSGPPRVHTPGPPAARASCAARRWSYAPPGREIVFAWILPYLQGSC